jgi:hypothetical protein
LHWGEDGLDETFERLLLGKAFAGIEGHDCEIHKQKHHQPNRRSLANLLLCASGSHCRESLIVNR